MCNSTPPLPPGAGFAAATWSSVWYLLAAFAVISYTSNWVYVLFAAIGSWIGGFLSITALNRTQPLRRRMTEAR